MNTKVLAAAIGAAALAISVLSTLAPASAQVRGYGQGYSAPYGGGSDDSRDRHDNRGGGFGGGNG
jgi:hypothetical protein